MKDRYFWAETSKASFDIEVGDFDSQVSVEE